MKPSSLRTIVPLALLLAAFGTLGCGEKPSFQEDTSVRRRASGDQQAVDEFGNPIKTGGKGTPGAPDSGEVDTAGDPEPPEGAGSGSGDGDAGKGGGDQGDVDGDGHDGDDHGDEGNGDGKGDGDGKGGSMGDDGDDSPDPDGNDDKPKKKTVTTEMTFQSHDVMAADATQNLDQAYMTQEMTLKRQYIDKAKQVKQIVRPIITDNFDQGHTGAANTETFNQVANRPLDILVMIDNSGSMQEEQNNLAGKLAPLLSYVQDADWAVGVVTTDPNQTCLRKLIKKGDADAAQAFATAVTAGTSGSNNERHVLQAVRSLSGTCLNAPWIRSESTLAIVLVTDEDNCSDGKDCPNKDYANGSYLYNYLQTIREPGKNARIYGIFWHPSQDKTQCPTGFNKANILSELVTQTNGTWGSICDADYSATLANVSQNIMVVLNSKFTLRYVPDPGTVRVFLNAQEITSGFTVTGKVVEISPAPADGTVVTISYRYGAVPIKSSFALRYKPMVDRTYVTVDGQAVPPQAYALDANAQTVTFAQAPAERAKIAVTYTRDIPLNQQYLLQDNIKPGTLRVKLDGVATTDYTVQEPVGLVTFNTPPAEGVTIDFAYTAVGAEIRTYPFSTPFGAPKDLVAYDALTGETLGVVYANGTITFLTGYVEGRVVTLRYDNLARQKFTIVLPNTPVPGTVSAMGCRNPQTIVVSGNSVMVDGCDFADDVSEVRVSYKYVIAAHQEFTFVSDNLPPANAWQEWHVWVNGQPTTDYVRTGNVIRFNQPLVAVSTVKIQLIQEDK